MLPIHRLYTIMGIYLALAHHFIGRTMPTGKKPASKAGKELSSKKSSKDEKTVAASDLAQTPRKRKGK
jgi:hypothetical protein